MGIKLPKSMVYYSESRNQPEYLLCWIPPDSFPDVARDDRALDHLRKYYPNGIEIEVSEQALEAAGIKLALRPDDLRDAYVQLHEENRLHESGMIAAETLQSIAGALAEVSFAAEGAAMARPMADASLLERTAEPPEMTGDEDAETVFGRLSGP